MYKQPDFCSLKLFTIIQKSGWYNGKMIRFRAKINYAVHRKLLKTNEFSFS